MLKLSLYLVSLGLLHTDDMKPQLEKFERTISRYDEAVFQHRPVSVDIGYASQNGIPQMRQLNENEIRAAIFGKWVGTDPTRSSVRSSSRGERFLDAGRYVRLSDRVDISGQYWFNGDELCVRIGQSPAECRIAFASDDGGLFFAAAGDASDSRPWPVRVEPIVQ